MNYFSGAIHIGMTATPKETKEGSSSNYFGESVYTYCLKQGIIDGFLAPFKVIRVNIERDLEGWRPYKGQRDIYGNFITDKILQQPDFDNTLFIEERTKIVAKRITAWLKENGRFCKSIVFCMNTEHADLIRHTLINENSDIVKEIPKYVMKITGDDDEGTKNRDNFIQPDDTGGSSTDDNGDLPPEPTKQKFYVNDVEVAILNERVQFIDASGKLITENLIDDTRKNILGH